MFLVRVGGEWVTADPASIRFRASSQWLKADELTEAEGEAALASLSTCMGSGPLYDALAKLLRRDIAHEAQES